MFRRSTLIPNGQPKIPATVFQIVSFHHLTLITVYLHHLHPSGEKKCRKNKYQTDPKSILGLSLNWQSRTYQIKLPLRWMDRPFCPSPILSSSQFVRKTSECFGVPSIPSLHISKVWFSFPSRPSFPVPVALKQWGKGPCHSARCGGIQLALRQGSAWNVRRFLEKINSPYIVKS